MSDRRPPVTMERVTDPQELARARVQRERFDRNAAWLQAHASEVYATHRGQFICVAGQEVFAAPTAEEALAQAAAAHPDDDGSFLHYVPLERLARIYANHR